MVLVRLSNFGKKSPFANFFLLREFFNFVKGEKFDMSREIGVKKCLPVV